jgi:hypothetical protein
MVEITHESSRPPRQIWQSGGSTSMHKNAYYGQASCPVQLAHFDFK